MAHSDGRPRIGIVSGVADELAAFRPDLAREPVKADGLPVQRLRLGEADVFMTCAGIGKVAAATGATLLHAAFGVELLMVIGTAAKIGALNGDVFNITEALQGDFGALRADGLVRYTAGSWPIGDAQVRAFAAMDLPALDLPKARIATSDLFIEHAPHAEALADALGVHLIDMETAAVAQTAAILGLPWLAIKATTDAANEDSAGSFVENLQAAAAASARAAERAIALITSEAV
jgi:adenosylhomocysteine nucleosidase